MGGNFYYTKTTNFYYLQKGPPLHPLKKTQTYDLEIKQPMSYGDHQDIYVRIDLVVKNRF